MGRTKKVAVGVLNIRIHPHSPDRYLQLFRDAFSMKRPAKISGDNYGLLTGMRKLEMDAPSVSPITGDIFRFTDIARDAQWFNALKGDFASEHDVEQIRIPEHLKPNSARFSYIFYPDCHLLTYEGYYDGHSLGPTNAERFMHRLLNTEELKQKYGEVEVTHIPEKDKVAEALGLHIKEFVELTVRRPNPDGLDEVERAVLQRMNELNASEFKESYKSLVGTSIEIDEELEMKANVAAKNGKLEIRGKDINLHPTRISTDLHPLTVTEYYDPKVQNAFSIFSAISESIKETVKDWLK